MLHAYLYIYFSPPAQQKACCLPLTWIKLKVNIFYDEALPRAYSKESHGQAKGLYNSRICNFDVSRQRKTLWVCMCVCTCMYICQFKAVSLEVTYAFNTYRGMVYDVMWEQYCGGILKGSGDNYKSGDEILTRLGNFRKVYVSVSLSWRLPFQMIGHMYSSPPGDSLSAWFCLTVTVCITVQFVIEKGFFFKLTLCFGMEVKVEKDVLDSWFKAFYVYLR